ncbi:winged helix-turn-helix domain-containing protein [Mesorhizobium sp. Z1-4]|uniref:winged helix-turn-helix domain-containing protein n=1 Tax=Mesorhizobium sp. Z1-4 TaxID=2448478 RepID=UPI0013DFAFC9|nr:winged helix-turn-helix domain-containing protein [Mesorhizobium sp. Z1-4]
MTRCPCCGQELPAGYVAPREELAGRLNTDSPVFHSIVRRLAWRPGLFVGTAELVDYVYRDDPDGGPLDANKCIQIAITRYRQQLEPLGWEIKTRFGRGYRLMIR